MICPKCGRVFESSLQACPSCGEKAPLSRKRSRKSDPLREIRQPRIASQVRPNGERRNEQTELDRIRERKGFSGADASRQEKNPWPMREENISGRRVRMPEKRYTKKVDAAPAIKDPPIYKKSHKRLKQVLAVIFVLLAVVISTGVYMLFGTEDGQQLMAEWRWDIADTGAYITLGKKLLDQGFFSKSIEVLDVVTQRNPRNVDALSYKAQAYTELKEYDKAIEIYESLIHDIAPTQPGAYRNLIRIYQILGYNAESLQLMKAGMENTLEVQEFDIMLRTYTPSPPKFSLTEGRYNEQIDVTILIPEGETVYYTTDGSDPSETGSVYKEGTIIHVDEGKLTIKAIGFTDNGMPSEQVTANYTVIIPTPAAPKSNYASGKYKKAPKVTLRPGSEDKKENARIVAIYYTLDGRQATTDSTLYTGPIQLPTGSSTLRAISVADNGKVSYEMKVTYQVEGNLKRMFNPANDSFKNLSLFKTSYETFVKNYGQPSDYVELPEDKWYDKGVRSYEAVYGWGYARFCEKGKNGSAVLYLLDTANDRMSGPRGTKVGMRASSVIEKFMDLGHPALDDNGSRLLYNQDSAGKKFGVYRKDDDGNYAIHYYCPADTKETIFIELAYFLNEDNGTVTHILWERYVAQ